jgi:secreted PhoX family phosphatase
VAAALPTLLRRPHSANATTRKLIHDPERRLHVAAGLEYVVLDRTGEVMRDGFYVPGAPDGMGAFARADGMIVLMRNHELWPSDAPLAGWRGQGQPKHLYDPKSLGAVTRLVVDPSSLRVIESNLVLAGTNVNCAGGASPFGWLSCEEETSPGHGYVFACPTDAREVIEPVPIRAYGRFKHESASVDPETMIAYLTEDRDDGCFYRFVPASSERPFEGSLQALRLEGGGTDTGQLAAREERTIAWVDLGPELPRDDSLRTLALSKGAARVRRGEGMFFARGARGAEVFFSATAGGPRGKGQVFRVRPEGDGGLLEVVWCGDEDTGLQMPDNLVAAPDGRLFLAEDHGGVCGLRMLQPDGRVATIAESAQPGELAGVALSPKGDVLFANLQRQGVTVAIRGDFASL